MHLHALQVMSNDGSGEFRMTPEVQEKVMAAVISFGSKKALRCLGLAYKHHSGNSSKVNPCHSLFVVLIVTSNLKKKIQVYAQHSYGSLLRQEAQTYAKT